MPPNETDTALRRMIEDVTGLALLDDEIERRLIPFVDARAARLGLESRAAYAASLRRGGNRAHEWAVLVEALTNGQTSFFRDPEQLDLAVDLLATMTTRGPLRVWSAGCATGQEPFSIAMLCAERRLPVTILATDLNHRFLDRARTGWFGEWELRKLDPGRRAKWFEPTGGGWRLVPEIRASIEFRHHNLVDEPPRPSGPTSTWNLVTCRNVFLYFRRERIAEVTSRMAGTIAADGKLVLSASESLYGLDVPLRAEVVRNRVVYAPGRDVDAVTPPPASPPPPRSFPRAQTTPATPPPVRITPPRPLAIPTLDRVVALAGANRLIEAIEVAAATPAPGLLDLLTLGHLHLRQHDIDAALDAYHRAGELEPLSSEVYYFLGYALRQAGRWDDAAAAFRKALFLAPSFWQASYLLAGSYQRLDRSRDGERERARVRKLLKGRAAGVAFVSHPLFVGWFSVAEDEARRLLQIGA